MNSMRSRVVSALSEQRPSPYPMPRVVPDDVGHGVLRWGYDSGSHHHLLHVRDDAIVAWNARTSEAGAPREPLPHAEAITAWMASVSEQELRLVTPERPMAFVDRVPVPALPFAGFAVVHPSVAQYSPHSPFDPLRPLVWLVFPCHRSEVARDMDVAWAQTQKGHVNWSNLGRPVNSALRATRYSKAPPRKPRTPSPIRPLNVESFVRNLSSAWVDIENWDRRVMRFGGGVAQPLDGQQATPLGDEASAIAMVRAFIDYAP